MDVGEPLPPWVAAAEMHPLSLFWRMGPGEMILESWHGFLEGLDMPRRRAVLRGFEPAPLVWARSVAITLGRITPGDRLSRADRARLTDEGYLAHDVGYRTWLERTGDDRAPIWERKEDWPLGLFVQAGAREFTYWAWAATEQRPVDDIVAAAPQHWQQCWTRWNADGGGTAWDRLAMSILQDRSPPPAATADSVSSDDDVDSMPYDEAWWCWFDEVIDDPTMWANYRQRHPLGPTWPGHRRIAATW